MGAAILAEIHNVPDEQILFNDWLVKQQQQQHTA